MKNTFAWVVVIIFISALALAACGSNQPATNLEDESGVGQTSGQSLPGEAATPPQEEQDQAIQESQPVSETTSETIPESASILPAVRQLVEINTSDGRLLEGFYYPAGVEKAPVIVLMHWAPGTMADWDHIAVWLQNRPAEADTPPVAKGTFHDPGWFPAMREEVSFAVLVFNFGKYGSSQYGGSRASYVLDAEAALQHAASLPGVDTHRMTAIGASIGADGVADACYLFNDLGEKGTCVGAFSLSPGNYLTDEFSYPFAVEMVNLSGFPVWCLAAEKDGRSPELCRAIVGPLNQSFIFPGSHHGMELLDPELLPSEPAVGLNALELLQEFLEQTYGIELNNFNLP